MNPRSRYRQLARPYDFFHSAQRKLENVKQVTIHTDGACEMNPGPGAWGAILEYGKHEREIKGHAMATTNNRMELQAAIEALRALKEPCEVQLHTDSEYLRDGMTLWVPAWKSRGWKAKGKKPVKNGDLWKELDELASKHKISWHWLRAHAGHPLNERCDKLATKEIRDLRSRHKPEEFAEALAKFKEQHAKRPEPEPAAPVSTAPLEMSFE